MTGLQARPRIADEEWRTLLVAITPSEVLLLTSLMESCDNLALVRTVDAAKGQLAIWFHAAAEPHVEEQLAWLAERTPLVILERSTGMKYLPEVLQADAPA